MRGLTVQALLCCYIELLFGGPVSQQADESTFKFSSVCASGKQRQSQSFKTRTWEMLQCEASMAIVVWLAKFSLHLVMNRGGELRMGPRRHVR